MQYFIHFKKQKTLLQLKKLCPESHFTPVSRDNGASDYCLKQETRVAGPWEFGTKPVRRNSKADWEEVKENAKKGDFEAIPADIYIRYHSNLHKIHVENIRPTSHTRTRGIWLWGPPGTGKTHYARTNFGDDVYVKPQNKWWCGYTGQKVVILDDLDTDCLAHYLKIWTDKWGCTGEIKGGTVNLVHESFIVTSNFSIEELFSKFPGSTVEAIRRRFTVIHFTDPFKMLDVKREAE